MSDQFLLTVFYRQIAVFEADFHDPFNDWSDQHLNQGFSWRSKSVSFRTISDGKILATVEKTSELSISEGAARAIAVPFSVGEIGKIEIASLVSGKLFAMDAGEYCLVFEHGIGDRQEMWCRFLFIPGPSCSARIIRADSELHPSYPLLMEASPAVP